jgi:hypothetical protein
LLPCQPSSPYFCVMVAHHPDNYFLLVHLHAVTTPLLSNLFRYGYASSSWATSGARVWTTATIRQQFATSTTCLRKEIATTQVLLPNHRMYAATTSPALGGVGGGAARASTVGAGGVFLPVYALDGLIIVSGRTIRKRTGRNAPPAMAPCSTHTMRAPITSCNTYIYNPR